MPINSRNKGAEGERSVAKIWFDLTGIKLERNLDQWRFGSDIPFNKCYYVMTY